MLAEPLVKVILPAYKCIDKMGFTVGAIAIFLLGNGKDLCCLVKKSKREICQ